MSSTTSPYALPYLYYRRVRAAVSVAYAVFILLPTLIVGNVIPSFRPDPRVSLLRTVAIGFTRWFVHFAGTYRGVVKVLPVHKIVQARLGELGARYDEAPAWIGQLKGEVKEAAVRRGIESVTVPLFWGGKKERSAQFDRSEERVLVSFHGGGYVTSSAHYDDLTSFAPSTVTRFSKTVDVFCAVDYRLSSIPVGAGKSVNPFPAALVDGITTFHHLVSLGYQARNIFLMGDSSGGNAVLALCRYLLYEENTRVGGLIAISPWADISGSHSLPGLSRIDNKKTDYLADEVEPGSYDYCAFLGGRDDCMSPETAYISPACRDIPPPTFQGFPRTFINIGENEQFVDEAKTLRERMRKYLPEGELVLDVTPTAPHNFYVSPVWEPERTELMQRIAVWIDAAPE